jgi:signal peptidase II
LTEPAPPTPEKLPAGGFADWKSNLALIVLFFIIDHATKWWATVALRTPPNEFIERIITVIPGFLNFRYAENTGAAFSIMDGKVEILAWVSLFASIFIAWWWYTIPAAEKPARYALALIFSGAVGNLLDRFARGFVVDFIDAHIGQHHWPTFNVADSCICIGAVILAWRLFKSPYLKD